MASGDLEIKDVRKATRVINGQTRYFLRFTVCNKTDDLVEIKIADNPWRHPPNGGSGFGPKLVPYVTRPDGSRDPGATRRECLRRWRNSRTNDDSPLELGPADENRPGEHWPCHVFTYEYDFEPMGLYIDAFIMGPDGEPEDTFSATLTAFWRDLQILAYDEFGPKPQYACIFPLPYPMALEAVHDGDIKVAIDAINGLPDSLELVHVFPPIGVPHHLDFGDRQSTGVFVFRQIAPGAGSYQVRIDYSVAHPVHLKNWNRSVLIDLTVEGKGDHPKKKKQLKKPIQSKKTKKTKKSEKKTKNQKGHKSKGSK